MYRVLCARESLREKRIEEGERYELRFSQKKSFWWILVKRAIYFSLSLLVLALLFLFSSRVVRVVEEGSIS